MSKGTDFIRAIVNNKTQRKGIPSLCSSNQYIIQAALEYAKEYDEFVLIEATANQVNQYGGYTSMRPKDFVGFVYGLADKIGIDKEKIIFGGDHLGPVVFADKEEEMAMAEAEIMIQEYVKAGFEKIHLDTSMRLKSDSPDRPLSNEVIAMRGARLCKAAEQTYMDIYGEPSQLIYVIGSEVPIPGGTKSDHEEHLQVTKPEDFEATVDAYRLAFSVGEITEVLDRVIAVVVQPGVEFGDDHVDEYNKDKARELTNTLESYEGIVFEGHSTDYQTKKALQDMIKGGVRILKVGPELTFALREGLFALHYIAQTVNAESDFINTLDKEMISNRTHWEKYYSGNKDQIALKRKFSFSDRWRYYANEERVKMEINKLFNALDNTEYPITILSQFMPNQYSKVRDKKLTRICEELVRDKVKQVIDKYYSATRS